MNPLLHGFQTEINNYELIMVNIDGLCPLHIYAFSKLLSVVIIIPICLFNHVSDMLAHMFSVDVRTTFGRYSLNHFLHPLQHHPAPCCKTPHRFEYMYIYI